MLLSSITSKADTGFDGRSDKAGKYAKMGSTFTLSMSQACAFMFARIFPVSDVPCPVVYGAIVFIRWGHKRKEARNAKTHFLIQHLPYAAVCCSDACAVGLLPVTTPPLHQVVLINTSQLVGLDSCYVRSAFKHQEGTSHAHVLVTEHIYCLVCAGRCICS